MMASIQKETSKFIFEQEEESEKIKKGALGTGKCPWKLIVIPVVVAVICALVIITWNSLTQPEPTPVIQISDGPVQGNIRYSRNGKKFWEFLGIPFGMPPVGKRKFQPPEPVEPWETVKLVTSYPPSCAQYDNMVTMRNTGDMDCLFLNVFVNVENINETKKPVLVHIHGGAFSAGGSRIYHPEFLMDEAVVLVVMNYRLGPYGFLNLQQDDNRGSGPFGNMGLMDQQLALQWVQKNIGYFSGNPNSVTLFGMSAGGASTHMHVLSPMSQGLFHRAIVHSGSALSPWAFSRRPWDVALEHAGRFGCPRGNRSVILQCYEDMDWNDVVPYQNGFQTPLEPKDMYAPTTDGTFLRKRPLDILKEGNFSKIPILFGVNSGEGGIHAFRFHGMPNWIQRFNDEFDQLIGNYLMLDAPLEDGFAEKIRKKYFGNATFSEDVDGFLENATLLFSDGAMFAPAHRSAMYHAKNGAPTYLFYYNYTSHIFPGMNSAFRAVKPNDWLPAEVKYLWASIIDWVSEHIFGGKGSHAYGVSHGEDVYQLWNLEGMTQWLSGGDADFSRSFVKVFVDFANGKTPLTFRHAVWSNINDHLHNGGSEDTLPFMHMSNEKEARMIPEPFSNRLKFWMNLGGWDYY